MNNPCECGSKEGCSMSCDRNKHPLYQAIEEARDLPPSSRNQTLDWILDRSAYLAKGGDPNVKGMMEFRRKVRNYHDLSHREVVPSPWYLRVYRRSCVILRELLSLKPREY